MPLILGESAETRFRQICTDAVDWLVEHGNPHMTIIVDQRGTELVEGALYIPNKSMASVTPPESLVSGAKSVSDDKYDASWVADITHRLGFTGLDYVHNLDNVDSGKYWVRFDIDECDTDNLTRMITEELQEAGLELDDGVYEHNCVSGNVDLITPEN